MSRETMSDTPSLIANLLGEDNFQPAEPRSLEQAGLSDSLIEATYSLLKNPAFHDALTKQ